MKSRAALTALMTIGALSIQATPVAQRKSPDISIQIQSTQKTFVKGEPIAVRVELRNESQRDLYVARNLDAPTKRPTYLTFAVWDSKGRPSRGLKSATDCFMKTNTDSLSVAVMKEWIALPPGASFITTAHVNNFDFLKKPGRYRISATYESNGLKELYFTNCVRATPGAIKELPFEAWAGRVEANSIWITIVDSR